MGSYSVSLDWKCFHAAILRVHLGPRGQVGDPFVWSCMVIRANDTAEICGVDRELPRAALRPLCEALHRHGFRSRVHSRHTARGSRAVLHRIRAPRRSS